MFVFVGTVENKGVYMETFKELRSLGYSAFEKEYSLSGKKTFEKVRKSMFDKKSHTFTTMADLVKKYDVRNISPAEMIILSQELYNSRLISEIDFTYLSFQPETHPNYNATIGKTTGTIAEPNRKRDFIEVWEIQVHNDLRRDSMNLQKSWRIMKIMQYLRDLRIQEDNVLEVHATG
tara:strand:+ start:5343 stop:5873 length:531 start_codon:yes stop_codon:yes gene_type:complete